MNVKSLALLFGVGIATVGLTPTIASAAVDGWTVRSVSQRAGPGPEYPRIGYVPGGCTFEFMDACEVCIRATFRGAEIAAG